MSTETEAPQDINLAKEKEMTLNIMDKVVRKKRKRLIVDKSENKKEKESTEQHQRKTLEQTAHEVLREVHQPDNKTAVYYEVADSLKNAFTKSESYTTATSGSAHVFKFHTDNDLTPDTGIPEPGDDTPQQDTLSTTESALAGSPPPVVESVQSDNSFLFFFHSSSRELRNRLDESKFCSK